MASRTNSEWEALIEAKVTEVKAEIMAFTGPPPLAFISSTQDPQFPLAIDHTLLKPDATPAQIDKLCDEALKYGFKSCCVNSGFIKHVSKRLSGSKTIPCSVVGFPLGAMSYQAKAAETKQAIEDGALEIDTVIPIGFLKSKDYAHIFADAHAIVSAAGSIPVKVILETVFLTDEEKIATSYIAAEAGAAFVKTCTGFSGGAASVQDVNLMAKTIKYKGGYVKVKASAGVRDFKTCLAMFKAGAERIGTSSGASIMENNSGTSGY